MIKAENVAKNLKKKGKFVVTLETKLLFLLEYDFGFMHIKAVDDAGHDKSLEIKNTFLRKINESLIHLFNCLN